MLPSLRLPSGPPIEQAVQMFAKMGHWSRRAEPEPGMVGCRASPELLALYGLFRTVENSNLSRPELWRAFRTRVRYCLRSAKGQTGGLCISANGGLSPPLFRERERLKRTFRGTRPSSGDAIAQFGQHLTGTAQVIRNLMQMISKLVLQ